MTDDLVPTPDLLAEVAKRVSEGYPELFRHQTAGVAFLLSRRRAHDAQGMDQVAMRLVAPGTSMPRPVYILVHALAAAVFVFLLQSFMLGATTEKSVAWAGASAMSLPQAYRPWPSIR